MDLRNNRITVRELLANEAARELVRKEWPDLYSSGMLRPAQNMTLEQVLRLASGRIPPEQIRRMLEQLRQI